MKKLFVNFHVLSFFVFLNIISPILANCQEKENNATYYSLFDQAISITNSGVFNGVVYVEQYPTRNNENKFFENIGFLKGSVEYNNQSYFNVALKYDVYGDELLIRNSEILGSPIAVLDKDEVAEFEINNHIFKNISFSTKKDKDISGYFEILFKNNSLTLFKKFKKKLIKKLDDEVYYEFKDQYLYYVYFKDNYYAFKKANFLNSIFPEYKTRLKDIYKRHETLRKTDSDAYLIFILKDLYNTVIRNNNSM